MVMMHILNGLLDGQNAHFKWAGHTLNMGKPKYSSDFTF